MWQHAACDLLGIVLLHIKGQIRSVIMLESDSGHIFKKWSQTEKSDLSNKSELSTKTCSVHVALESLSYIFICYTVLAVFLNSYPQTGAVRVGSDDGEAIAWFVQAAHSKGNDGGVVPGQKVLWSNKRHCYRSRQDKSLITFLHFLHILLDEKWFTRWINIRYDASVWFWHTTHSLDLPSSS